MLIDQRVAEIAVCIQNGEPVEGLYLSHLLSSDHMSRAEVYTCITELLLGGVDTVRRKKVCHGMPQVLEVFCVPECATPCCILGGCFIIGLPWQLVRQHSQGEVEACRTLGFCCKLQICEISASGLLFSPFCFSFQPEQKHVEC